jgi:hypothetical protein
MTGKLSQKKSYVKYVSGLYLQRQAGLLDLAEMTLENVFIHVPENAGQHQLVEQEGREIGDAPLLPEQYLQSGTCYTREQYPAAEDVDEPLL